MAISIIPAGVEHTPDYFVPEYDKDVILEPNFFCRARNTKREKYCRARAGQGTEHLGQGRCRNHGGMTPIIHGRYSEVVRGTLGESIDRLELESEKEKLDILPEATFLRAITLDTSERWQQITDALVAWNQAEMEEAVEKKSRPRLHTMPSLGDLADLAKKTAEIVNMVHKQRSANAITMPDFYRLMAQMADCVSEEMDKLERFCAVERLDTAKLAIQKRWKDIKLKA